MVLSDACVAGIDCEYVMCMFTYIHVARIDPSKTRLVFSVEDNFFDLSPALEDCQSLWQSIADCEDREMLEAKAVLAGLNCIAVDVSIDEVL